MDIAKLKELAAIHANVDHGSPTSVRSGNVAADEIRSEVRRLAASGLASELIPHLSEPLLGPWFAYALAELPGISESQRSSCIARIKEIALAGGLESSAAKLWLRNGGYVS
ncbi:MAG: hypothetical protein J0L65_05495 [Xanthomonadales bacterium]|nr:hypothetical protein [Xanthomonadales bacterium]